MAALTAAINAGPLIQQGVNSAIDFVKSIKGYVDKANAIQAEINVQRSKNEELIKLLKDQNVSIPKEGGDAGGLISLITEGVNAIAGAIAQTRENDLMKQLASAKGFGLVLKAMWDKIGVEIYNRDYAKNHPNGGAAPKRHHKMKMVGGALILTSTVGGGTGKVVHHKHKTGGHERSGEAASMSHVSSSTGRTGIRGGSAHALDRMVVVEKKGGGPKILPLTHSGTDGAVPRGPYARQMLRTQMNG